MPCASWSSGTIFRGRPKNWTCSRLAASLQWPESRLQLNCWALALISIPQDPGPKLESEKEGTSLSPIKASFCRDNTRAFFGLSSHFGFRFLIKNPVTAISEILLNRWLNSTWARCQSPTPTPRTEKQCLFSKIAKVNKICWGGGRKGERVEWCPNIKVLV